jgi:Tannase and feruloyl esterase
MQHFQRRTLTGSLLAATVAVTAGCFGDDNDSLPQLSAATAAAMAGDCAELTAKISALANTSVTAVNKIAAGAVKLGGVDVPEHCQVLGKMHQRTSSVDGKAYAIGFEMRLPKAWNGRFFHQGNGGIDGAVVSAFGGTGGGPVTNALFQGFAVLSSDAGHSGSAPDFGIDPQARLDYGYQAVAKLTPMAKDVVKAAYGKAPDRSYFGGCSNGGRHALVAAARYGGDYDGILAGAPGYNLPKAAVANLAGARLYASVATASPVTNSIELATGFTDAERRLVATKVLEKCDALDGASDGMVQDLAACQTKFTVAADVPTCVGARDGSCLTAAQKTVVAKIFSGPTTSAGALIYRDFPFDAGISGGASGIPGSGVAFWEFFASLNLDAGATGIIFNATPANPVGFNGPNFSLTTDIDALNASIVATAGVYTESAMSFMTPPNPTNLSTLRNRGGKLIVYHGNSDAIFSVNDSEVFYNQLQDNRGTGSDPAFARFYRVPGMGHCSGGPAADQFDLLTPLVKWVEAGTVPQTVVATARGSGNAGGANADVPAGWATNRTRPLCPYPKVARYNGSGTLEDAANFSCQ